MLVDDLHRIHAFLYIPTKRIFYHFDCQNAYLVAKTVEIHGLLGKMVGLTGFEPATSRSRTERSTKLSHNPLQEKTLADLAVKTNGLCCKSTPPMQILCFLNHSCRLIM